MAFVPFCAAALWPGLAGTRQRRRGQPGWPPLPARVGSETTTVGQGHPTHAASCSRCRAKPFLMRRDASSTRHGHATACTTNQFPRLRRANRGAVALHIAAKAVAAASRMATMVGNQAKRECSRHAHRPLQVIVTQPCQPCQQTVERSIAAGIALRMLRENCVWRLTEFGALVTGGVPACIRSLVFQHRHTAPAKEPAKRWARARATHTTTYCWHVAAGERQLKGPSYLDVSTLHVKVPSHLIGQHPAPRNTRFVSNHCAEARVYLLHVCTYTFSYVRLHCGRRLAVHIDTEGYQSGRSTSAIRSFERLRG